MKLRDFVDALFTAAFLQIAWLLLGLIQQIVEIAK